MQTACDSTFTAVSLLALLKGHWPLSCPSKVCFELVHLSPETLKDWTAECFQVGQIWKGILQLDGFIEQALQSAWCSWIEFSLLVFYPCKANRDFMVTSSPQFLLPVSPMCPNFLHSLFPSLNSQPCFRRSVCSGQSFLPGGCLTISPSNQSSRRWGGVRGGGRRREARADASWGRK